MAAPASQQASFDRGGYVAQHSEWKGSLLLFSQTHSALLTLCLRLNYNNQYGLRQREHSFFLVTSEMFGFEAVLLHRVLSQIDCEPPEKDCSSSQKPGRPSPHIKLISLKTSPSQNPKCLRRWPMMHGSISWSWSKLEDDRNGMRGVWQDQAVVLIVFLCTSSSVSHYCVQTRGDVYSAETSKSTALGCNLVTSFSLLLPALLTSGPGPPLHRPIAADKRSPSVYQDRGFGG
ncbi:hypothetical protein NQZ68_018974 [Dissostichus eleginoides]|nr:hypothetical protein NQZ68_018974 [Dissostichus eleginoides]